MHVELSHGGRVHDVQSVSGSDRRVDGSRVDVGQSVKYARTVLRVLRYDT